MKELFLNPIIYKEFLVRMREKKAFTLPVTYIIVLILIVWGIYHFTVEVFQLSAYRCPVQGWEVGRNIFWGLSFVQLVLVLLITPGLTAGAITLEKEQLTLPMLQLTLLSSRQIVFGKLFSALTFIGLLLFLSLPIMSLSFVFGGVSLIEVLQVYLVIFMTAVMFGVIGLYNSSFFKSSTYSTSTTQGVMAFFIIFSFIFEIILSGTPFSESREQILSFIHFNPFYPFFIMCSDQFRDILGAKMVPEWSKTVIVYLILSIIFFFMTVKNFEKKE